MDSEQAVSSALDFIKTLDLSLILKVADLVQSPAGLLGAAVVGLIVLTVLRKVLSFAFLVLAVVAIGWAGWRANLDEERAADDARAIAQAAQGAPRADLNSPAGNVLATVQRTLSGGRSGETAKDFAAVPMAYNRPHSMSLANATNVSLVIDLTGRVDLQDALRGYVGDVVESTVDVSGTVSATLTGPGFTITPLSPPQQVLSETNANRWQWTVTPEQQGERLLTLEIFAHPAGGAAEPVRAYRDEIMVTVGALGRARVVAETAEPFFGVAAGGGSFIMAVLALFRRRRVG